MEIFERLMEWLEDSQSIFGDLSRRIDALEIQMCSLNKIVKNLKEKQDRMDVKIEKITVDIQRIEDESRINRTQVIIIKWEIAERVNELLGESNEKYKSGFIRRCYADCKRHGKMTSSRWDTAKSDYKSVIKDIRNWIPAGGVEAYKKYLDLKGGDIK